MEDLQHLVLAELVRAIEQRMMELDQPIYNVGDGRLGDAVAQANNIVAQYNIEKSEKK